MWTFPICDSYVNTLCAIVFGMEMIFNDDDNSNNNNANVILLSFDADDTHLNISKTQMHMSNVLPQSFQHQPNMRTWIERWMPASNCLPVPICKSRLRSLIKNYRFIIILLEFRVPLLRMFAQTADAMNTNMRSWKLIKCDIEMKKLWMCWRCRYISLW